MPQGGKSNPNASGAVVDTDCYKAYTSGRFDDNYAQQGEGQIHSVTNDGYPYPGKSALKQKVKT